MTTAHPIDWLRTAACITRWAEDNAPAPLPPAAYAQAPEHFDALVDADLLVADDDGWRATDDGSAWAEAVFNLVGETIYDPITPILDAVGIAAEEAA